MVFDSWGGVLADGAFQAFSLAYNRRVLKLKLGAARRRAHPAHRLHQGRWLWLWLEQIALGRGRRGALDVIGGWTGP